MSDLTQDELNQVNQLREQAQIGMDAEAFKNSPLGQYMLGKAAEQKAEVVEQLILADPTDTKLVSSLQGHAVLLGLFEEWLDQAITDGSQAMQFFKNYED